MFINNLHHTYKKKLSKRLATCILNPKKTLHANIKSLNIYEVKSLPYTYYKYCPQCSNHNEIKNLRTSLTSETKILLSFGTVSLTKLHLKKKMKGKNINFVMK